LKIQSNPRNSLFRGFFFLARVGGRAGFLDLLPGGGEVGDAVGELVDDAVELADDGAGGAAAGVVAGPRGDVGAVELEEVGEVVIVGLGNGGTCGVGASAAARRPVGVGVAGGVNRSSVSLGSRP